MAQLLSAPAALVTPTLAERWEQGRTYALGSLGVAASLLPLALFPFLEAAGVGFMCVTAFMSITTPVITAYHQEVVSPGWRATMSGTTNMAAGLGWAVIAMVGGYVITAVGYRSLFLIGAALALAGALLLWGYFRVPRGELIRASASSEAGWSPGNDGRCMQ